MLILMDIDNTITPSGRSLLEWIARERLEYEIDTSVYSLSPDISIQEIDDFFTEMARTQGWMKVPPYKGCVDTLRGWAQNGARFLYMTARAKYYKRLSIPQEVGALELKAWLTRYGLPDANNVAIITDPENKANLIEVQCDMEDDMRKIDVAIDDYERCIFPLQEIGIPVILKRQPWNQHLRAPAEIQKWTDVSGNSLDDMIASTTTCKITRR